MRRKHICRHTTHRLPHTPSHICPGFFCLFWLDWGVLGVLFLLNYGQKGTQQEGKGKLPGQLPSGFGPWKATPFCLIQRLGLETGPLSKIAREEEGARGLENGSSTWKGLESPGLSAESFLRLLPPRWPHQLLGHRLGLCIGGRDLFLTHRDIGVCTEAQSSSEMYKQRGPRDTQICRQIHTLSGSAVSQLFRHQAPV